MFLPDEQRMLEFFHRSPFFLVHGPLYPRIPLIPLSPWRNGEPPNRPPARRNILLAV